MKNAPFPINSIFLKNALQELEIKQWWLAQELKVDRKTVQRWIQGEVKTVKKENIDALAKILNCSVDDLILKDEIAYLASADDQREAAKLLLSSSIVDRLGPLGEWNVIESLLKATIVENLSLQTLGEMYTKLTVSLWRQSKIEEAWSFNQKAESIAIKLDDKELLAKALLSKANIYSWKGESLKSIATYEECLSLKKHIDPKSLAAAHSNLGGVLYELGNFSAGLIHVNAAVDLYEKVGTPMNLAIAHIHKAIIYLKLEDYKTSFEEADKAMEFAEKDNYKRGIFDIQLIMAVLHAKKNDKKETLKLIESALKGFKTFTPPIDEGLSYEFIGRAYRYLKMYPESLDALKYGASITQSFPLYLAYIHYELSLTYEAMGVSSFAEERQKAKELFMKTEAYLMVEKVSAKVL